MGVFEDLLRPILSATDAPWWKTLLAGFALVLLKGFGAMHEQKHPGSLQQDPASARPHYERAYELANQAKASYERAYAARGLAVVFEREGKFKEAQEFAKHAFHIYQQSGDPKLKDAKDIMYRVQSKMPMAIEHKDGVT